jgi:phage baseplate assembly protein W
MTKPNPNIPPPPIGWPLLPVPDNNGELSFPTLEASVRQQIRVILQTTPGEQLMRPEFGAGLGEFLHEPNTLETRRQVRDRISDSLSRWEPRILVDRVDVEEVDGSPAEIRAQVHYRLRRTGFGQSLGVTIEVQG